MTVYEMFNRERKINRLLAALDTELGHTATEADCNNLTVDQLRKILAAAKVESASQTTIDLLVERLRERDRMKGEVK